MPYMLGDQHKSTSLTGLQSSPRQEHKKFKLKSEEVREQRPNVMRADVVDKYIKSVMETGAQMAMNPDIKDTSKNWVKIVEQIYRLNLDNRILNNLRQQLNECIEDERGLVTIETFRKMFFTFFKGEQHAH